MWRDDSLTPPTHALTRADLASAIDEKLSLSRSESALLVDDIVRLMFDALKSGQNVKIAEFGAFMLRDKNERMGRNPKTGVETPITARRVLTFRASRSLKDRLANG